MKIEQSAELRAGVNTPRRKQGPVPPGTVKSGLRLDDLIEILTSMRAAGVPDHANIELISTGSYYDTVRASWTEER